MRMPPRGERYVAASWIAVGVALLAVVAGTMALLVVWDDLPQQVALRSTIDGLSLFVSRSTAAAVCAVATVTACLVWLGVGVAVHKSARHRFAGSAAGSAVGVAILLYGTVVGQRHAGTADDLSPVVAAGAGFVVGFALHWWTRPVGTRPNSAADLERAPTLTVPDSSRLAWVGTSRMSWPGKILSGLLRVVPALAAYYWLGMVSGYWWVVLIVVAPTVILLGRDKQVAVDYSGVGLRQRNGRPSPVPMRQIRSASVQEVSVLRDFGGWGKVTAPDGRQGWITRSGEALVVHRWDKPDVVYTVDDADEAAGVLNTLVARCQQPQQPAVMQPGFIDLPPPYGDAAGQ